MFAPAKPVPIVDARSAAMVAVPSPKASPSVSPSPTPARDEKQPNAVQRFFSWTFEQVTRPFRRRPHVISDPPIVVLKSSTSLITFCPFSRDCETGRKVTLSATAGGPEIDKKLLFSWRVTGGRLSGADREVTWDLGGLPEGNYVATVEVDAGNHLRATDSTTVKVSLCPSCDPPPPPCPTVSVSCPTDLGSKSISFEAIIMGGDPEMKPTYAWSVSAGRIISGQGTSKIQVDISNRGGQSVTATVLLGGAHPACTIYEASCTLSH